MRLLAAGYVTRLGKADPIHHFESPRRQSSRMFVYGARNNLLWAWYYVPTSRLPAHWGGMLLNLYRYAIRNGHPIWTTQGVAKGVAAIWHERAERVAVPLSLYQLSRKLAGARMLTLAAAEPALPSMRFAES
jgi:hypothetical protein